MTQHLIDLKNIWYNPHIIHLKNCLECFLRKSKNKNITKFVSFLFTKTHKNIFKKALWRHTLSPHVWWMLVFFSLQQKNKNYFALNAEHKLYFSITKAENPYWRGRLSTVDLLIRISLLSTLFIFYKTSYLNEEVNRIKPSPSVRIHW
jgi:hypothetical protein